MVPAMRKQTVIEFFDGVTGTASAVGITPQAVSQWPDPLPPRIQDRVIAAAVRCGKDLTPELIAAVRNRAETLEARAA